MSKRLEDHPKLKHAQKITHRAGSGKFKKPPHQPGAIAPADPPLPKAGMKIAAKLLTQPPLSGRRVMGGPPQPGNPEGDLVQ